MDHFAFLKAFHNISQEDYQLLTGNLESRTFSKGEHIITPGQTQREMYFVQEGVQMSYFETPDKTHVIAFTYPPGICAIPESFAWQKPSEYYLTCLSKSEMLYITYPALMEVFDRSQAVERLFRKMTEAVLAGVITRHIELHAKTIEERFRLFCNRSPHLLQMVPHKYIASYLGINPTNFSKLYNNIRL